MTSVILAPTVPLRQPAPVFVPLPAAAAPVGSSLSLVDEATGERVPAQRDGERGVVAVIDSLPTERRFRLEPRSADATGISVARTAAHRVEVRVAGELLTAYEYDPANARPFFYPLNGPTGEGVTRNFPMKLEVPGESKDHPHHRSMWSAYGEVNGTDNWSEGKNHARQVPDGAPELVSGPVFGRLRARNQWVGPNDTPELEEQRVLTVYNVGPERRLFDYEITFTAAHGDVHFGDTKEGGLLSFRVATSMDASGQGRIENSRGGVGERECWGKPAEWCDYSGPVAGKTVGIAVMDDPGNFRSPVHWHVRDYGLMTTNCFGDSTFAGNEGGHLGDYILRAGQSFAFRYRVLLHRGHAAEGGVADGFAAFTHGPAVRVE
jgi:Methane oxygenase PmoA